MKPVLLALHSLPRAGKDTLGQSLVLNHDWRRTAFADPMYQELAETFGVSQEELRSDEWKRNPQDALMIWKSDNPDFRARMKVLGHDLYEPRTSRWIAQHYATEYRRHEQDDYWLIQSLPSLEAAKREGKSVAICDLRFPNEWQFAKRWAANNGYTMHCMEIVSPRAQASAGHVSDHRLPDHMIDTTIVNPDGAPEIMIQSAHTYLNLLEAA